MPGLQRIKNNWPTWLLLSCALLSAAWVMNHHYPDEWGQVTRFYAFKLGWPGISFMPWEYHEEMRSWFQPGILYLVAWPVQQLAGIKPMLIERVIYLAHFLFFAITLLYFYRWLKSEFETKLGTPFFKKLLLPQVALLWFVPSMMIRHSSETLALSLLVFSL